MTGNAKGQTNDAAGLTVARQVADLLGSATERVTEYCCKEHPDRTATAVCERCGADLCSGCRTISGRQLLCAKCTGSIDRVLAGTGTASLLARIPTHPLVVALVLIALLGVLFVSLGKSHRKGLLGETPASAVGAEKQLRLRIILYAQKADRIETRGDALHDIGRLFEAKQEYRRVRAIYEALIDQARGRWEEKAFTLARARILEKEGEYSYAQRLYKNLAGSHDTDTKYRIIAGSHLAKLQEKTEPEQAVETYRKLLQDIAIMPDSLDRAINIMGSTEGSYRYESRLQQSTRTNIDFKEVEAETLLHFGRLLLSMNRISEARFRLERAAMKGGRTTLADQARAELRKLRASEESDQVPEEEVRRDEQLVITHFEKPDLSTTGD